MPLCTWPVLCALALFVAAGCDSDSLGSFAEPEEGTFSARVVGTAAIDYAGDATFRTNSAPAPTPPSYNIRAQIRLVDGTTGSAISFTLYQEPQLGLQPSVLGSVRVNGEHFQIQGGTLMLTAVSAEEITGHFEHDVRCCAQPLAGLPGIGGRMAGRFNASFDGDVYR